MGDLLEGEEFGPVHEDDLFGHAVGAAQVAAVRHADAQVVVLAPEGIGQFAHFSVPGWTHSVRPSAQFSFFQIGTSSLRRSMAWRHASKAWARCGQLTATATLTSPTSRWPVRWTIRSSPTGQRRRVSASISAIFFSAMPGYAS